MAWMSGVRQHHYSTPESRRTCALGGRADGFGRQHYFHFAIAAQGLFEQVKSLRHHQPSLVRLPRAMARRTSLTSGLAALVIVSALAI